MSKVPSLSYLQIIAALERDEWVVVRQRGVIFALKRHYQMRRLKSRFRLIVL